jgi:hypothetical protein
LPALTYTLFGAIKVGFMGDLLGPKGLEECRPIGFCIGIKVFVWVFGQGFKLIV